MMCHGELLLVGKVRILESDKFLGEKTEVNLSLRLHVWLVWVELKRC